MALIELDDVCLQLPVFEDSDFSFRRRLLHLLKMGKNDPKINGSISALKNISLTIKDGESVGLVGLNGAGKTTMLKLLAGIYSASSGNLQVQGTCSTIFDLSLGMDIEASGYENLFIAGYMLGLSRSQINERIEELIDFTELGEAIKRPLRTYSSGMRVRLAFAIITSFRSDIMLIDEIIGVGDVRFLKKASERIQQLMNTSKIVVLASHAEFVLKDFCKKGLLIHKGCVVMQGSIDSVIDAYNSDYVKIK